MQETVPVHALVDSSRQGPNLIVFEVGAAGQHPANKEGGIDGRYLRLKNALAVLNVEKVAEKTVRLGHARLDKPQRCRHSLADLPRILPAAPGRNPQRRQTKASRRDAAYIPGIWPARRAAI